MTKVAVIQQDAQGLVLVQDISAETAQQTSVSLGEQGIAKLSIPPEQITAISRQGHHAVVQLQDGSQVTLENFFNQSHPQIVLQQGQQLWAAAVTVDASGQVVVDLDYAVLDSLTDVYGLTAAKSVEATVPTWGWVAGAAAGVGLIAAAQNDDKESTVQADTTPPVVAKENQFSADGKSLNGQAEAGSRVIIKDTTGQVLATATADTTGHYHAELPAALINGESVTITVQDQAGNQSTVVTIQAVDSKAPIAGTLSLSNFEDTGLSATDGITQDNHFDLTLSGQEANSTVVYQVSQDQGQTWQTTTAAQANLTDGVYQFKAVVTDQAGNQAETAIQTVTVDRSVPAAGVLSLSEYQDTGLSSQDFISQDKNFNLMLTGHAADSHVVYQMSSDAGQTWTQTAAQLTNLADGRYLFKAIVTDVAGNSTGTYLLSSSTTTPTDSSILPNITTPSKDSVGTGDQSSVAIGIDAQAHTGVIGSSSIGAQLSNTANSSAALGVAAQTGVSTTGNATVTLGSSLSTTDVQPVTATKITSSNGTSVAIGTGASVSIGSGSQVIDGVNSSVQAQFVVVDTIAPVAGKLSVVNFVDTGSSAIDGITYDHSFELSLTGQEANSTVVYQVSTDDGLTWQNTTAQQTQLADGIYQFKAVVTDLAGNTAETYLTSQSISSSNTDPITSTVGGNSSTKGSTQQTDDSNTSVTVGGINGIQLGGSSSGAIGIGAQPSGESTTGSSTIGSGAGSTTGEINSSLAFKIVIDTTLEVSADNVQVHALSTDNILGLNEKDQNVQVAITLNDLPIDVDSTKTIIYSEIAGVRYSFAWEITSQTWVTEIPVQALWTDQDHNTLNVHVSVSDLAGNTQTIQQTPQFEINHIPTTPMITLAIFDFFQHKIVEGVADPNIAIDLYNAAGEIIGSTLTNAQGQFKIDDLPAGDVGEVYVVAHHEGYQSVPSAVSALQEVPVLGINRMSATGEITGYATAGSILVIKAENGDLIESIALDDSSSPIFPFNLVSFTVQLSQALSEGTTVIVTVEQNGVSSYPASFMTDFTAPQFIESPVFDEKGQVLSGAVNEAKAYIVIRDQWGSYIAHGQADDQGSFSINLDATYSDAELFSIAAIDQNRNMSSSVEVIAPDYVAAPVVAALVNAQGRISGWADEIGLITIKDAQGHILAEAQIGEDGNQSFVLQVNRTLIDGEQLYVIQTSAQGEVSVPSIVTVDATPPSAATQLQINAVGDTLVGQAEPGSRVTVSDASGSVLGGWGTQVNADGTFSIEFYNHLTDGQVLYITVTDSVGNESLPTEVIAPDYAVAPEIYNLTKYGVLTGATEDQGIVTVKDAEGDILGQATVTGGSFRLVLNRDVVDGEPIFTTVTDVRDNTSASTVILADLTAPSPVQNLQIGADGQSLTGQVSEANVNIEVFDQYGFLVGRGQSYNNGQFYLNLNQAYFDQQQFNVVVLDRAGNASQPVVVHAPLDETAPAAATDLLFESDGYVLTGKAEPLSNVQVFNHLGQQIASGDVNSDGHFNVYLHHYYLHGEQLKVTVTDQAGHVSPAVIVTAPLDNIAPVAIKQIVLDANGSSFTARAEANTQIEVKDSNGQLIGSGYTDSEGVVNGYFTSTYLDGQTLKFTVIDRAGNQSQSVTKQALIDRTAPDAATALEINEDGTILSGVAEAHATIKILNENGDVLQTWTDVVAEDGSFSVNLYSSYLKSEQLTVVVQDRAGNASQATTITAPLDDVAPNVIEDLVLNANGGEFSGKAELSSTVIVLNEYAEQVGYGYVGDDGEVRGHFNTVYLNGQSLTFIVVDLAGNQSDAFTIAALNDMTAPEKVSDLELSDDGFELRGQAEVGAELHIFDAQGKLITVLSNAINADGTFSLNLLNHNVQAQVLTIKVVDRAGNVSEAVSITVPKDDVAPDALTHIVLDADGRRFSAQAEANSRIEVRDLEGQIIGYGYTNEAGQVSGYFHEVYLHGQDLSFIVIDRAGNQSSPLSISALHDTTVPKALNTLYITLGGWISGEAEPNSTIEVLDQYGAVITVGYAYNDGAFTTSLNLSKFQSQTLSFVVKDAAGNRSEPVERNLPEAQNSPTAATNVQLDAEGHVLTGTASAGMYILVTNEKGEQINNYWHESQVGATGQFSVQLDGYYLQGQTLQVRVYDSNASETFSKITEIVAAIDDVKPLVTAIEVIQDGAIIIGNSEPKATIKVIDAEGDVRIQAIETVDALGHFDIGIYPRLLPGEQVSIFAIDLAGNVSEPVTLIIPTQTDAPLPVEYAEISDNGVIISGQATAFSAIEVVDLQSNTVGYGYTDSNGQFSFELSQYQANGQQLRVVVIKDGYYSQFTEINAPIDLVAPQAATQLVMGEGNYAQILSGQAEAFTTVLLFNPDGQQIDTAKTDQNGNFVFNLWNGYWHAETLTVKVVDANGNQSTVSTVQAPNDTTAPAPVSQLAINEWGNLEGQAEAYANIAISYHISGQGTYTNTTTVDAAGHFSIYMHGNPPIVNIQVIDRAGNTSEVTKAVIADLAVIQVDTFSGDSSANQYYIDHISDFVQEDRVDYYEIWDEVWVDNSYYQYQWVDGYYDQQWVEGSFENVWIEGYGDYIWIESGEWRYRDYYSSADGTRYYTDDSSYDAYLNQYYDANTGQWQDGAALEGPYVEEEWFADGYYEYQWIEGHYEEQFVEAHYEDVWIEGYEEYVWVDSGYWEEQLTESGYQDVDFGGVDRIVSSVSYSLSGYYQYVDDPQSDDQYLESGRYVEELELVGTAHLNATGNALDNTLIGNSGNNILQGLAGDDVLIGQAGSDTAFYQILDQTDATGGNGHDVWMDFQVGDVATDDNADQIDIADLLIDYVADGSVQSLLSYINVKQDDVGNTVISIDRDGSGSLFAHTELLTLNQVNVSLDELLNQQQLII